MFIEVISLNIHVISKKLYNTALFHSDILIFYSRRLLSFICSSTIIVFLYQIRQIKIKNRDKNVLAQRCPGQPGPRWVNKYCKYLYYFPKKSVKCLNIQIVLRFIKNCHIWALPSAISKLGSFIILKRNRKLVCI